MEDAGLARNVVGAEPGDAPAVLTRVDDDGGTSPGTGFGAEGDADAPGMSPGPAGESAPGLELARSCSCMKSRPTPGEIASC